MIINKILFIISATVFVITESKKCSEITASSIILDYCKNGSECTIENIGDSDINNNIVCNCLFGYSLPDCSLLYC
ncbi:hypothetical protein FG379_000358 [Cryptosporidium bovis]|uniref:uncharacterized protein n=1 Tax=Cryptosporidium bovis TaxID=310047 RepID=UPI00351A9ED6|nr:hypothetical protein FG379_000358 [Cryptosporidium bovis]